MAMPTISAIRIPVEVMRTVVCMALRLANGNQLVLV